MRLTLVFSALIGVNVYFLFLRGGTSLRALIKTSELRRQGGAPALLTRGGQAAPAPTRPKPVPEAAEDARVAEGKLSEGDTFEGVFKREGLEPRQIGELVTALRTVVDPRTVRPGHGYTLRFDAEDHLREVDYRVSPALAYRLERVEQGFRASKNEASLDTRVAEVGGTIGSSLYDAIKRAGESTALVGWFVDMFAWDLNFYIDSQPGDRFKVVVEKLYLAGKFYKYGRVLAAEYQGQTGTFRAFWFQPRDGSPGAYYTAHGESVVKNLLKSPLKYVRISSRFDRHRFHPVLHSERAHLGVDYAAPTGTPVWASASGKVSFAGRRGGGGNVVMIRHPNGLESVYMHLSRFAAGLRPGQAVRQKQVIGYVGSTGLSTGPHLHFSLKRNGAFVDPLRLRPQREAALQPKYRVEFADTIAPRLDRLSSIPTRTPAHLVSRGLSAMP